MSEYAGENLLRLMADGALSIQQVSQRSGLDERTIRGIVNGTNKPHARTLHRLAAGLDGPVDECCVDPALLVSRRFDWQTNLIVKQVVEENAQMFAGWKEADFDELHSRFGAGGGLTREGTIEAVKAMNQKRNLYEKLALLLESSQADLIAGVIELAYRQVVEDS